MNGLRLLLAAALLVPGAVVRAAEPPSPTPAENPATAPTAEPPPWSEPDPLPVPPGTAADQALWKATRDATHEVAAVRYRANALQLRVRNSAIVKRLNAAAEADPASAARFVGLRQKVASAQLEDYGIYTAHWPVDPTRVCQYPLVDLTSAMNAGNRDAADRAALAEARDRAAKCVDLARGAARKLGAANDALAAALDAAEAALGAPAAKP